MLDIILQLHGSGGGSSNSGETKWIPNEYQSSVLGQMTPQYKNYLSQSNSLLNSAGNLYNGLATQNVDYAGLYNQSVGTVDNALSGIQNSAQGNVSGYLQNEQNALQSVLNNTMGTNLNNWAKNGVINSSVATSGLNSIAQNAASTAAQDYNTANSNQLNANQAALSGAATNLNNASTAQNAAQIAASNLLTDSLSAYNASSGILGTGASTATNSASNGSGNWLSTLTAVGAGIACFVAGTLIDTPLGKKAIEYIKAGDKVIAYESGVKVTREVLEVQTPVKQQTIEIVTDDGWSKHFVETTKTQPLLDKYDNFIKVEDINIGTELKQVGKVIAMIDMGENDVYDLKVSGKNTYIANDYIAYGRM